MTIRFLLLFLTCAVFPIRGQTGAPYINFGNAVNQIVFAGMTNNGVRVGDSFVNEGLFRVQYLPVSNAAVGSTSSTLPSPVPYDMTGIRYYTNDRDFLGHTVDLDFITPEGDRGPAESFINTSNGRLDLVDSFILADAATGLFVTASLFDTLTGWEAAVSNLRVDAKHIENHGLIRIGAGGRMSLGWTNELGRANAEVVDLSRGILATDTLGSFFGAENLNEVTSSGFLLTFTAAMPPVVISYLNPLGVYDEYWGAGTFTNQNLANGFIRSLNPMDVTTPLHRITNSTGGFGQFSFELPNAQSWAIGFTAASSPTGVTNVFNAVFVETDNTNILADVKFSTFTELGDVGPFFPYSAIVKLDSVTPNVFTALPETNSVYIFDELGTHTNITVIANERYLGRKPTSVFISRADYLGLYASGLSSNLTITSDFFYTPGQSISPITTNMYAAYSFSMDNFAYFVPPIGATPFAPATSVYDYPGRIEIRGRSVNLTDTGIRGEGLVSIDAEEITPTSSQTLIDAQNLAFNLTTTASAPLRFANLAKTNVNRLQGFVSMWSGVFTNITTNALTTNMNIYHTLIVDARGLTQTVPVMVADFQVRVPTTLDIVDNMIISNRFFTTARDLNVSGAVTLLNTAWGGTNLPNLANLTIAPTGVLGLAGQADIGTIFSPLTSFVDRGTVSAYSLNIFAQTVDVSSSLISGQSDFFLTNFLGIPIFTFGFVTNAGPINVTASTSARFDGAAVGTYGSVNFSGPIFKFDRTSVAAGGSIIFNVTSVLQDSGLTANSRFASSNSINLTANLTAGRLLGSTFVAQPPARGTFLMTWSVPASPSTAITNIPTIANWDALTNATYLAINSATPVGDLRLESGVNTLFDFRGTQAGRALYVDRLEIVGNGITNLTSLTNQIRLSNIDIYYAELVATNLKGNFGFTNLSELLNNKTMSGGGKFHWMPNFNGPNSSEDVVRVVNGVARTVSMNRALRRSRIIDMDSDGIANAFDDIPLNDNNPAAAQGAFAIAAIQLAAVGGHIQVAFSAYPGNYELQVTDTLSETAQWTTVTSARQTGNVNPNATLNDPNPISEQRHFYRLLFRP
jgi:hypothetical protein